MKNFRALETRSLVLVYGALVLASLITDALSHGNPFWSWQASKVPSALCLFGCASFVIVYTFASSMSTHFFKWAQEIEKIFRQVLTPLSYMQILILSLLSGFVEEWFFRGVLVTHFGVIISAIIFGLGHFIPISPLWIWGLISFFAGIVFGVIYQATHSLLALALMHSAINFILLIRLNREAHKAPALPGLR